MRLSRRKIARYVAGRLATGDELIIEELAALIIEERRERDIDLLVRDIEDQLAQSGMTIATVETAKPLSETVRQSVRELLGGDVRLREEVRPELIGGIRIETPTQELDGTISQKIYALKSRKV